MIDRLRRPWRREARDRKPRPASSLAAMFASALAVVATAAQEGQQPSKELAVLNPPGPAVGLAFSRDGSRLLTVGGSGTVWDVAKGASVCTLPAAKGKDGGFGYAALSADGSVAVTGSPGLFRAWDAATGQPIGPEMRPPNFAIFLAAALSADGKLLALVSNERSVSGYQPIGKRPRRAPSELTVWDLKAGKPRWKLVAPADSSIPAHSLCFSPDAKRLVLVSGVGDLKVLILEEGQETPREMPTDRKKATSASHRQNQVVWLPGGRAIELYDDERDIDIFDPNTLAQRDAFTLEFVGPAAPPRRPNELASDPPRGLSELRSSMSADGTRLVVHLARYLEEKKTRRNFLLIFDVRAKQAIARLQMPEETYSPGFSKVDDRSGALLRYFGSSSDPKIAISGDGRRVAFAEEKGVVRIYDVPASAAGPAAKKKGGPEPVAKKKGGPGPAAKKKGGRPG